MVVRKTLNHTLFKENKWLKKIKMKNRELKEKETSVLKSVKILKENLKVLLWNKTSFTET